MMARRSAVGLLLAAALCAGCDDKEGLDPQLGKVRPAAPARVTTEKVRYAVSSESVITVSFGGKAAHLKGRFAPVSGALEVDLMRLAETRGSIAVDLTNPRFEGAEPGRDVAREAVAWLGLGADSPEAERQLRRHATLDLFGLEEPSAPAAHAGELVRKASESEAADADGEPEFSEERSVRFTALADLTLNGRKATMKLPATATFRFTEPALTGSPPDRITVESRGAVPIELSVFDVVPRDSRGTVLSSQRADALKALRGRALVRARLVLERTR